MRDNELLRARFWPGQAIVLIGLCLLSSSRNNSAIAEELYVNNPQKVGKVAEFWIRPSGTQEWARYRLNPGDGVRVDIDPGVAYDICFRRFVNSLEYFDLGAVDVQLAAIATDASRRKIAVSNWGTFLNSLGNWRRKTGETAKYDASIFRSECSACEENTLAVFVPADEKEYPLPDKIPPPPKKKPKKEPKSLREDSNNEEQSPQPLPLSKP